MRCGSPPHPEKRLEPARFPGRRGGWRLRRSRHAAADHARGHRRRGPGARWRADRVRVFLIATGFVFRLPLPVQPMKAIGAVVLTGGLSSGEVAAAGMATGLMLLVLGATGAIGWMARVVPRSAVLGLQVGLGLAMAWLGAKLLGAGPLAGGVALVALLGLPRLAPGAPAAPLALLAAAAVAWATGWAPLDWRWPAYSPALPEVVLPVSWEEAWRGLWVGALPQLPLTLANAVVLTVLLARELFPGGAVHVTERRLSLSTGAANLLLAPLGAMPMCHGASGLVAQHRFGARTGLAPALLGLVLLILGRDRSRCGAIFSADTASW